MRSHLPSYEVRCPTSVAEALQLLSPEWRPLAGGTDLMVQLEAGTLKHQKFLSLHALGELKQIQVSPTCVTIGALVTHRQLQDHPVIQSEFPAIREAAENIGAIAIQNRGTIGGNIANASPAADLPPALLVHEPIIELASASRTRKIAYRDFHTGYKQFAMLPNELIRSIELPRDASRRWSWTYRKVGARNAQAISKVCFAGRVLTDSSGALAEIRIALGSVASVALRCRETENLLRGKVPDRGVIAQAKQKLAAEIAPIDDIRSTAEYRRRVSMNLLEEYLLAVRTGKCHVELGE